MKIGLIGGSGMTHKNIFDEVKYIRMETPFGEPSDYIAIGRLENITLYFIPSHFILMIFAHNAELIDDEKFQEERHGGKHTIPPSSVNYRANVWCLKSLGCTHIIATTATSSLQEKIKPGDLLMLSSFINRTTRREGSFYNGELGVGHVPMQPSFCEKLNSIFFYAANNENYICHPNGRVVTVEGPRFPSLAENNLYHSWGADVVNMTTLPEVCLAKELSILYVCIASVTDYCHLKSKRAKMDIRSIVKIFESNANKVANLIKKALPLIERENWNDELRLLQKTVEKSTYKRSDIPISGSTIPPKITEKQSANTYDNNLGSQYQVTSKPYATAFPSSFPPTNIVSSSIPTVSHPLPQLTIGSPQDILYTPTAFPHVTNTQATVTPHPYPFASTTQLVNAGQQLSNVHPPSIVIADPITLDVKRPNQVGFPIPMTTRDKNITTITQWPSHSVIVSLPHQKTVPEILQANQTHEPFISQSNVLYPQTNAINTSTPKSSSSQNPIPQTQIILELPQFRDSNVPQVPIPQSILDLPGVGVRSTPATYDPRQINRSITPVEQRSGSDLPGTGIKSPASIIGSPNTAHQPVPGVIEPPALRMYLTPSPPVVTTGGKSSSVPLDPARDIYHLQYTTLDTSPTLFHMPPRLLDPPQIHKHPPPTILDPVLPQPETATNDLLSDQTHSDPNSNVIQQLPNILESIRINRETKPNAMQQQMKLRNSVDGYLQPISIQKQTARRHTTSIFPDSQQNINPQQTIVLETFKTYSDIDKNPNQQQQNVPNLVEGKREQEANALDPNVLHSGSPTNELYPTPNILNPSEDSPLPGRNVYDL